MHTQTDKLHRELQALNRRVSILLRICVVISIVTILAGLIMFNIKGGSPMAGLTPISTLPSEIAQLNPAAFITAGLILILLMPVAIIIASFAHFVATKERNPIIVCSILLIMLAASYIFIVK